MLIVSFTLATFGNAAADKLGLSAEEAAAVNRIVLGDAAPPDPAILRWRNGETLTGELAGATASEVRWKSPLFEGPLRLAWTALRRIDRTLAPVAVADPFGVVLRDGSHLYGDLLAVTNESISIRSTRCGALALKRSEVLAVHRLRGGNLIAAGPSGDAGWRVVTGPKRSDTPAPTSVAASAVPVLKAGPGGALLLPYWNRGAVLDLEIPERVDLEFRVRSSMRPDFQLSLAASPKDRLRVETWDEELVLVAGEGFKAIRKIAGTEREVALRVCWDRKTRKCSIFTPAGEWITDWEVPEDDRGEKGQFVLQNKGRDLALESLRVRTWDGQPPPKLAGNLPRVEFADGRIVEGAIGSGAAGSITVGSKPASTPPMSTVDALVFSTDLPRLRDGDTSLTFADGTLIRGRIASITGEQIALISTFTTEPITVQTRGLRQVLLDISLPDGATPELPLAEWDTLSIERATLHGRLASAGDERPRWLPVGGVAPALLAKEATCEITRALPANAKQANPATLVFTTGGDVLPGILRGLDRSGVDLDAGVFEQMRLPVENLDAIVFNAATTAGMKGFGHADWRILRGNETSVRKTDDSVRMQPETALGHPSIMQSSEIQFSLATDGSFGGVRLRLFSGGDDRTDTANLVLANMGSRLYYGMEAAEGQMDSGLQQTSLISSGDAVVRLLIDEKRVELHVNGVTLRSFPIPAAKRKGLGIVIKPANVFGNEERPITLSNFSAKVIPGRIWMPDVSAETRTQALTVPRFRKDDPPRHALLGGNGDVLRGEIEAMTATHFGFRSGLENLRVPRERVKAAIWLKPPEKDAAAPEAPNPARKILDQKLTRQVRYSIASLSSLTGVLQREAAGLKFKLPAQSESRKVSMQFGEQTIGEALDEICELFSLRYRVEEDGTIVLEGAPPPSKDLLKKVYWLKPGAFSGDGSAQAILATRGVSFSPKSGALWQPKTGQLTMTNTPANHEKLSAVLDAEFGGSLGSPTHWLLLASGARFGLAVDKFEPEFIRGRHPAYGECRVPVSDVHIIRTSPPETTAAMKSLEDWRLTYAPEPVLPESGGESSPAVGKTAKTFKLPLLGGGDFDLAGKKGKVVVLDFWATWCGPCIKSLPALIEAMAAFPSDQVMLLGVNQSEPAERVKQFLETRGWKFSVAMDAGQNVARQYGVEGIPHTVIVGPDGNVAWVKTGYSPDGATEAATAVKQLLAAPAAAPK